MEKAKEQYHSSSSSFLSKSLHPHIRGADSTLKFFLKSYKYPGGKFNEIYTWYPFYSARQISLARASLSVFVPLLCLSFICKLSETSDP